MRARQRHFNHRSVGATLILDSRRISGKSNGDAISQWDDISSNAWNVTQPTSTAQPTYRTAIQGGQPVVRFDGNDRLISSSVSTTQNFSSIVVFRISESDTGAAIIFDSYNNTRCAFYAGQTSDQPNNFVIDAGNAGAQGQVIGTRNTIWNVFSCQFSAATSYGALNGIKTAASSSIGTNGLNGLSLGNLRGNPSPLIGSYELNGDIALMILIPTTLLDGMRKRLEHAAAYSFKISCS